VCVQNKENPYGGFLGPEAVYVKLTSADGHEFIIKRVYAEASETLQHMLHGPVPVSENETLQADLKNIP
jgi:hypothetical protein